MTITLPDHLRGYAKYMVVIHPMVCRRPKLQNHRKWDRFTRGVSPTKNNLPAGRDPCRDHAAGNENILHRVLNPLGRLYSLKKCMEKRSGQGVFFFEKSTFCLHVLRPAKGSWMVEVSVGIVVWVKGSVWGFPNTNPKSSLLF